MNWMDKGERMSGHENANGWVCRRSCRSLHGAIKGVFAIAAAFVLLLGVSASAFASSLRIGTPEELVERASRGRAQFYEVLRDLDKSLIEMRSRAVTEPYLLALADLEVIATKLKLDEVAGEVFAETARQLTVHGLRWLRLDADTTELVLKYHRYADEAAADEVLDRARFALKTSRETPSSIDITGAELMVVNLQALEKWAEATNKRSFLIEDYREVRGAVALVVLKGIRDLSPEQSRFWITHLASNAAIGEFLKAKQIEVLALKSGDVARMREMAMRLGDLKAVLDASTFEVDGYLRSLLGEIGRELITRFIRFEVVFGDGVFEALAGLLEASQLQGMVYFFTTQTRVPSRAYAAELMRVATALLSWLERAGLITEHDTLKTHLEKAAGVHATAASGLEGTYRVRTMDGRTWRFNLIFSRHDQLVAGIGEEKNGVIYFAYYNMSYDVATGMYVASERTPTEEVIRNAVIRFKFDGAGAIEGAIENVPRVGRLEFRGKKFESYRDFLNDPRISDSGVSVDGMYVGRFDCGEINREISLYVQTVNNYQLGRISFGKESFFVEFPYGARANSRGVIYLTSAAYSARSFIHFRGWLRPDGQLTGDYIIGGIGQTCGGLVLKKVK